jgi:ribosome-associated toxin RatA of RatAB toxin-antitoxin module
MSLWPEARKIETVYIDGVFSYLRKHFALVMQKAVFCDVHF